MLCTYGCMSTMDGQTAEPIGTKVGMNLAWDPGKVLGGSNFQGGPPKSAWIEKRFKLAISARKLPPIEKSHEIK